MNRSLSRALLLPTLPVVAAVLGACDDGTGPGDRIVEGVNLTALFTEPTPADRQAILDDWAARDPVASDVRVEISLERTAGGVPATLRVLSVVTDGNRHYGGVQAPDDAAPGSLPVVLFAHGGDGGTGAADLGLIATAMGDLAGRVVLAAPAFRSEPFVVGATSFRSEGEPSPWDRDVDDALAFLDAVAATTPAADPTRVAVLGLSRGGGVALLMAIRDPGIDQVVEFFGPTDMFDRWVQDIVESALRGSVADLPGVAWLNEDLIQPLRRGELTIDDVRTELIRRSAVLFADRLPPTQVHHGRQDPIVPVSQAESLIDAMEVLGRTVPEFEGFIYPDGTHNPLSLPGAIERTRGALERMVPAAGGV